MNLHLLCENTGRYASSEASRTVYLLSRELSLNNLWNAVQWSNAPVFPIVKPGITTAFPPFLPSPPPVASTVALIVPANSFHGPLSPVGVIGEGSSWFPQASERITSPALSDFGMPTDSSKAVRERLKEATTGARTDVMWS